MMAGYSGTPLRKKLGIKDDFSVKLLNAPANYAELVSGIPGKSSAPYDFIHIFSKNKPELQSLLNKEANELKKDGMIWVSWPKKASKVLTDITEDTIREFALPMGLVDIKVCAVDEVWSGLKLVWRQEKR